MTRCCWQLRIFASLIRKIASTQLAIRIYELPSASADGRFREKFGFSQNIKMRFLIASAQIRLKRKGRLFTGIRLKPVHFAFSPLAEADGNS
jgi:hypothetical protein